jgi:hypothetical protein
VADLARRIVFYRWGSVESFPPFDRIEATRALARLPDDDRRPLPYGEFSIDVVVADAGGPDEVTKLLISRLRGYDERPWARAPGEQAAPTIMRPEQSMLDYAQVVMWPDEIVAFTMGGHSPAPSSLVAFLLHRADQQLLLKALYDPDVVEKLRRWKGVRSVALKIHSSPTVQQRVNSDQGAFAGLFNLIRNQQDSAVISTQISVDSRGEGARSRTLDVQVGDVMALATQPEAFDNLSVSGLTAGGRIEHLDLLTQRLQVAVRLPRAAAGGHRTDDRASFNAIPPRAQNVGCRW